MKFPKTLVSILILVIAFNACQNEKPKTVITEKIQYDVNLKSPDPSYDWWIQNIAGGDREKLVDMILSGAKDGKYQAYDYYNNPINPAQVRSVFSDTLIQRLRRTVSPFEEYDTTIIMTINNEDILRLRFLEKWEINPENLQVTKTIYGIAPIARRIYNDGIIRWQPLFWIYTNDEFVKSLKNK